jgi:hypothetical protein
MAVDAEAEGGVGGAGQAPEPPVNDLEWDMARKMADEMLNKRKRGRPSSKAAEVRILKARVRELEDEVQALKTRCVMSPYDRPSASCVMATDPSGWGVVCLGRSGRGACWRRLSGSSRSNPRGRRSGRSSAPVLRQGVWSSRAFQVRWAAEPPWRELPSAPRGDAWP